MSDWRYIPDGEYEREFKAVHDRIFSRVLALGRDVPPFKDPDWRLIPMPFDPINYLQEPGPERPRDFPPIEPYFDSYYEPLYLTLAEFGIDHVVLQDEGLLVSGPALVCTDEGEVIEKRVVEELPAESSGVDLELLTTERLPSHPPILMAPSVDAAFSVREEGPHLLPTTSAFSREGNWGLVWDWEEIAMLGGTPEFIEVFYRICGGERATQARFLYFLLSGGCGYPDGIPFTPFYYLSRRHLVRMYEQAGWPLPRRWFSYSGEELDWSWMMDDEGFPEK